MTNYLGVSGTPVQEFSSEYLDRIYSSTKEKIVGQLPEARHDIKFLSLLDENFDKLKSEVLTIPVPPIPPYFSQNPHPIQRNNRIECNKSYKVDGYSYKINIFQDRINVPQKIDSDTRIVVMPIYNAAKRIVDVLESVVKSFIKNQSVLFVICINQTNDDSYSKIKNYLSITNQPTVINILPPDSVQVQQPALFRTLAQNINLRTIQELDSSDSCFLVFVEDDIIFPIPRSFEKITDFMSNHTNYKVVGFNPYPYPEDFLDKINYLYHPWYYKGFKLMGKATIEAPIPQPEIHGGSFIIRKVDHPEQLPSDLIAQDGWLSNRFTRENMITSTRFTGLYMYHHEPTCLARRLSKIKTRNLSYGPKEMWNQFLVNTVTRKMTLISQATYKNWPKDESALAILIRALKP